MKINWFGRMYYGKRSELKRPFLVALQCFWYWDINIFGKGAYMINGKYVYYNWLTKRKIKKQFDENLVPKSTRTNLARR